MTKTGWIAAAFAVSIPGWVAAGPFDDPADASALIAEACVTTSLDWDTLFADAQKLAVDLDLPQIMASDEAVMYGDPAAANLMFARRIDSMACRLSVPPDTGTEAFYTTVVEALDTRIKATYPEVLSVEADKPSPHEAKHDWVFRVAKERHFAVTVDWIRDRGVSLNIGYSQIYE